MNLSKLVSKKEELKLSLANISFIDDGHVCLGCTECTLSCSGSCTGGCDNRCTGAEANYEAF